MNKTESMEKIDAEEEAGTGRVIKARRVSSPYIDWSEGMSVNEGSSSDEVSTDGRTNSNKRKPKVCEADGCHHAARSGTRYCISHGGGTRCLVPDCARAARDKSGKCIRHGGGPRCIVPGCGRSSERKNSFCMKHKRQQGSARHSNKTTSCALKQPVQDPVSPPSVEPGCERQNQVTQPQIATVHSPPINSMMVNEGPQPAQMAYPTTYFAPVPVNQHPNRITYQYEPYVTNKVGTIGLIAQRPIHPVSVAQPTQSIPYILQNQPRVLTNPYMQLQLQQRIELPRQNIPIVLQNQNVHLRCWPMSNGSFMCN